MTCAKHSIRIMCLLFVKISWDGGCFDHSYFTENKAESRVIWPGLQTLIIDWHSIHLVHKTPSLKSFYHDKTPSLHKYMKYYLYIQSISLIRAGDACRWGLGWFFLSTQKNPWHRRVNCWKKNVLAITNTDWWRKKSQNTWTGLSLQPLGTACTVVSVDLICAAIDSLGPSPSVLLMALASSQ